MGCYMNGFGETTFNKSHRLVTKYGAVEQTHPKFIDPKSGEVTICVVTNYHCQAVGVAFDIQEFNDYRQVDDRPKMFLTLDLKTVKQYAPNFDRYYERSLSRRD